MFLMSEEPQSLNPRRAFPSRGADPPFLVWQVPNFGPPGGAPKRYHPTLLSVPLLYHSTLRFESLPYHLTLRSNSLLYDLTLLFKSLSYHLNLLSLFLLYHLTLRSDSLSYHLAGAQFRATGGRAEAVPDTHDPHRHTHSNSHTLSLSHTLTFTHTHTHTHSLTHTHTLTPGGWQVPNFGPPGGGPKRCRIHMIPTDICVRRRICMSLPSPPISTQRVFGLIFVF